MAETPVTEKTRRFLVVDLGLQSLQLLAVLLILLNLYLSKGDSAIGFAVLLGFAVLGIYGWLFISTLILALGFRWPMQWRIISLVAAATVAFIALACELLRISTPLQLRLLFVVVGATVPLVCYGLTLRDVLLLNREPADQ